MRLLKKAINRISSFRYKLKFDYDIDIVKYIFEQTIDDNILEYCQIHTQYAVLLYASTTDHIRVYLTNFLCRNSTFNTNTYHESKLHRNFNSYKILYEKHGLNLINVIDTYIQTELKSLATTSIVLDNYIVSINGHFAFAFVYNIGSRKLVKCTPTKNLEYDTTKKTFFTTLNDNKIHIGDYIRVKDHIHYDGVLKVDGDLLINLCIGTVFGAYVDDNCHDYYDQHTIKYNIPPKMMCRVDKLFNNNMQPLLKKILGEYET